MSSADVMIEMTRRVTGALTLDAAVYEEVEADRRATVQATIVVLLASIGAGLGNAGIGASPLGIAVGAVAALMTWILWAALICFLGTRIVPEPTTEADLGQLLRTMGFAAAPGMFRAFEIFGGARWVLLPAISIWMIAAMVVAVRQSLDYASLWRAIAVCTLGWLVSFGALVVVGALFTEPVY
jgi:hypothetical protein